MAGKKRFTGKIGRSLYDTKIAFQQSDSPSKGKPNVIYILMDDMGFAQLGCYGSNINTPNIDRLAAEGLRYNNFHTTAVCSATRASLLTGMNHHSCGVNTTTEARNGLDNNLGGINPKCATIAEILKEYDYRTFAVGKWHLCGRDERTDAGPFQNWPLQKGFDNYYGFLAAHMDQWHPILTLDNTMVEQPKDAKDGYHATEDFVDHAIQYIYRHHFSYPEQPFFLYLSFGAMHAPHHAPREYIDAYKGKFDQGWDAIRSEWFEKQKELGVIPENAELTDRNEYVPAWDTLSDRQKKAYARYMETYAGMLTHTDAQIGRLIDYLQQAGILDNTIIVFTSDNGASAEGGKDGHYNQGTSMDITQDYPHDVDLALEHYDTIGDEYSMPHYPIGWANAGNTPFQWYKTWVYEGGIKDPLIIRYPAQIKEQGGIRGQFNHVSDITPTILDMLELEKPEIIKGVPQKPLEGISFKAGFTEKNAVTGKDVQYFEMFGNRSIYKDGWKAVTNHEFTEDYSKDVWELYHVEEDYSEKHNVADQYPEKVKELEQEWFIQAAKYGVFPMEKFGFHAYRDQMSARYQGIILPAVHKEYKNVAYPYDLPDDPGLTTRTNAVTIRLNRKTTKEEGVLISSGDRFGGASLYVLHNRLNYVYNLYGETYYHAVSDEELLIGDNEIKVFFDITGKGKATVRLYQNGKKTAQTQIEEFNYMTMGVTSFRVDKYTAVYEKDYKAPFSYTGDIPEIVLDIAAVNVDAKEELTKELHAD